MAIGARTPGEIAISILAELVASQSAQPAPAAAVGANAVPKAVEHSCCEHAAHG
jgi:xanthine/CO dehydrogenase XdhC/CoxF family maturation factor